MKTLAISEVRGQLPSLIEEVADTRETVVITRHGKPRACLVPYKSRSTGDTRYPLRGLPIEVADDFDEPMPGVWEALSE